MVLVALRHVCRVYARKRSGVQFSRASIAKLTPKTWQVIEYSKEETHSSRVVEEEKRWTL
jgi:hypothetical protein